VANLRAPQSRVCDSPHLNNGLDPNREHQHLHERLDNRECMSNAGGVIRPHGNDQVGFRRLLAPVFAFVVEARHDGVARPEVKQDSGQR
jgi:hypothetical protein